jgi:hypothetical protein
VLESGLLAKRGRPGAGAHPHSVLGHPVELGYAALEQGGKAVDQQPLEELALLDPEVAERLVVDAYAPAQPLEGEMLAAQARQAPCAADTLQRGVEPQRHHQARIGRGVAGSALHGFDLLVERSEVELLREGPHQAHAMIMRDEVVEAARAPLDLAALGLAQARPPSRRAPRHGLLGQVVKQPSRVIVGHGRLLERRSRG